MKAGYLFVLIVAGSSAAAHVAATRPDFSAIRQELRAHIGKDDVPGLAIGVSVRGKIIWAEGFGWADRERHLRATPSTPFYIASVTKSITAAAILHLAEHGKLRLDDPVNEYLGESKLHSPVWDAGEATIRQLLSHTSGLTTYARWCNTGNDPECAMDREVQRYGVLMWRPGEVFDYSNLGYGILGYLAERVSRQSLDSYLKTAIFQPLRMRNCSMEPNSPASPGAAQYDEKSHLRSAWKVSGHEGASGLHCSARDLLSFGMFHLKEHFPLDPPVSRQAIDDMHSPQPATQGQYGLGWWTHTEEGVSIVEAQGGTTDSYALLELIPAKEIAIVVVANSYSKLVSELNRRILMAFLPGLPQPEEPNGAQTAIQPPVAALTGNWSGEMLTYQGPVRVQLTITNDGSAQAKFEDGPVSPLTDISFDPESFYGRVPGQEGLPDSLTQPFQIEFNVALHGKDLIGAVVFGPTPGKDGNQLPHFVRLGK